MEDTTQASTLVTKNPNNTCHGLNGSEINFDFCDEMSVMLICAYIQLILPIFSIGGSFFFRKDYAHVLGANIPALCSMISGSLFLALEYRGKLL